MGRADTQRLGLARSAARCRGVVMVITLLAIFLIAALLFYVINTGRNVQGRVVTQHAADATAIAGASQVARSMNTIAMNNVETARLIVAVSMLDSVPLAVDKSITDATETELGDTDALAQAVSAQLRERVTDDWFERKLREIVDENSSDSAVSEQAYLRELDALFRDRPDLIPEMAWYKAPSGEMGRLHQAMRSMDAQSRAVMQTFSEVAQSAASRSAPTNLGSNSPGAAAMLLPAMPTIPWQRGVFDDFERPIKRGLLPGTDRALVVDTVSKGLGHIDHELTNRGPWDALFGWRITDRIDEDPGSVPGDFSLPPAVGRPSTGREPEEYHVFGAESGQLRTFPWRPYSRLRSHIWGLYSTKTNYLWTNTTRRTTLDSQWEIDVEFDDERSNDRNGKYVYQYASSEIRETAFVIVEIKSRLPNEQGLPQRQGQTWNYTGRRSPRAIWAGGWRDPRNGPPFALNRNALKSDPTWTKIQDHIWRLSAVYETDPEGPDLGGDPAIGLPPKQVGTDTDGNPVYAPQDVYWEIDVMLVGVNVGEDIDVTNPWEGFDRTAEEAPAPIDLVHSQLPPNDDDARWQYLTFLGVARQSNRSSMWPSRFDSGRPYPYNTAIAQAYVFNNHSWDLWTQSWQATLEPVSHNRFNQWLARADDAAALAGGIPDLDTEEVREMADHLRTTEPLAPVMLNH